MCEATSNFYGAKIVVITGSSRGVGFELTKYFLAHGATVVGLSRGGKTLSHPFYHHFSIDIGNASEVQMAFLDVSKRFSRVDVLINNASVLTSQYSLVLPASRAEEMIRTNLLGTFLVSREAAKIMKKNKFGRIINIGSMAASLEPAGDSVYAACKAGVSTLANVMAREFSLYNITCNTLGISAIETEMLKQLPKDRIDSVISSLPLPRYATIEDIINVIDFFASERSSYITAQTIFLAGVN